MRNSFLAMMAVLLVAGCSQQGVSVPPIGKPLEPQQYTWYPQRAGAGPVLVFVSIPRQEAVAYRNGVRIGRAAVSTGRDGHQTPTGVFQILEKDVDHYSKTYNNAPMPYMQRLTWEGVALHAGFNPGQPDSHGCIRLPVGFAKELYGMTRNGGTVIVSNSSRLPTMTLASDFGVSAAQRGDWAWKGKTNGGATTLIMSVASQQLLIYQNGSRVGEAPVEVKEGMRGFKGESVFLFGSDHQWHSVEGGGSIANLRENLLVAPAFRKTVRRALQPGATMVITSETIPH